MYSVSVFQNTYIYFGPYHEILNEDIFSDELVSENIRLMRIFAGFSKRGTAKRQWATNLL